jgi:hypothetical protein
MHGPRGKGVGSEALRALSAGRLALSNEAHMCLLELIGLIGYSRLVHSRAA